MTVWAVFDRDVCLSVWTTEWAAESACKRGQMVVKSALVPFQGAAALALGVSARASTPLPAGE